MTDDKTKAMYLVSETELNKLVDDYMYQPGDNHYEAERFIKTFLKSKKPVTTADLEDAIRNALEDNISVTSDDIITYLAEDDFHKVIKEAIQNIKAIKGIKIELGELMK